MKKLSDNFLKLKKELFFLEKEKELVTQELNLVRESIKDCNWRINKDSCQKLLNLEKPHNNILNISEIFLFILNQKEINWKNFKELLKNFSKLKSLMSNFTENDLNEEKVSRLMELWKSNENLDLKLKNKYPECSIILKWMISLLELKLKSRSLENCVEKYNSINKELQNLNNQIKEINTEILKMKINLKNIKYSLEKNKDSDKESKITKIIERGIKSVGASPFRAPSQATKSFNDYYTSKGLFIETKNRIITLNDDSVLEISNVSYDIDENNPVNGYQKTFEENDFFTNTFRMIKPEAPKMYSADKPLPQKKLFSKNINLSDKPIKIIHIKENKKIINDLPSFNTKSNNLLLKYGVKDSDKDSNTNKNSKLDSSSSNNYIFSMNNSMIRKSSADGKNEKENSTEKPKKINNISVKMNKLNFCGTKPNLFC